MKWVFDSSGNGNKRMRIPRRLWTGDVKVTEEERGIIYKCEI